MTKLNSEKFPLYNVTEDQANDMMKYLNLSKNYQSAQYALSVSIGGYRNLILGSETISGSGQNYGTQLAISSNKEIRARYKNTETQKFGDWELIWKSSS